MPMNMTECVKPPVHPAHNHLDTLWIEHVLGIVLSLTLLIMSHGNVSLTVLRITLLTHQQDIVYRIVLHHIMPMMLIKHVSSIVLMAIMLKIQLVLVCKIVPLLSMLMLPPTNALCSALKPHRHMLIIMCV